MPPSIAGRFQLWSKWKIWAFGGSKLLVPQNSPKCEWLQDWNIIAIILKCIEMLKSDEEHHSNIQKLFFERTAGFFCPKLPYLEIELTIQKKTTKFGCHHSHHLHKHVAHRRGRFEVTHPPFFVPDHLAPRCHSCKAWNKNNFQMGSWGFWLDNWVGSTEKWTCCRYTE